eukprot:TRINITY_DN127_c0_g1_i6.p1 TRINITY_DN127_c0_g1~~TRINITY_DN127_c0_g1_i6.p1  ORF type:complete len:196 (-),score=20.26 TRINITY_DN127_c0_g1_i6:506-1093(-)
MEGVRKAMKEQIQKQNESVPFIKESDFVAFPEPHQNQQFLLFPFLNDWKAGIPLQPCESFKTLLEKGVDAIRNAGVALLDMRPANLMWRQDSQTGEYELRFIDHEDSHQIGQYYLETRELDERYPHWHKPNWPPGWTYPPEGERLPLLLTDELAKKWMAWSCGTMLSFARQEEERSFKPFCKRMVLEGMVGGLQL